MIVKIVKLYEAFAKEDFLQAIPIFIKDNISDKPILFEVFTDSEDRSIFFPETKSSPGSGTGRRKRMTDWVIVVDDDKSVLRLVCQVLRKAGIRPTALRSGAAALDFVKQNGFPDLVLLDVNMPETDGFETLKLLKKQMDPERSSLQIQKTIKPKAQRQSGRPRKSAEAHGPKTAG